MKYKKQSLIVEAVQFTGDLNELKQAFPELVIISWEHGKPVIPTLEGDHQITLFDYIVKGIAGEFYPCKPDIFKATYTPVQFKTVGVKYATSPNQVYTFMTDEDCKVGDKAVVFTQGRWSVVTIIEIHDEPQLHGSYKYTWLVQIIDRTNYDRHIAEDGEGYPSVGVRL